MTSRSASVQRRMLGAAVLKGTGVAFMKGRLSRLQHSLVPQIQSGSGVTAQHDSCQPGPTWLCVVCAWLALSRDSEVMGFFQPRGGKSEMFWKEEGVEESRTEALSGLSRGGWGECRRGGRDG